MAATIPTELGLRAPSLRPVASPVDTFKRTAEGSQLAQLGNALSGIAPALGQLGGVIKQQDNDKKTVEGENKANELIASGKTWKQAVDEKLIDLQDNPFFLVSAQNQFGKVLGNRYADDLAEAVKLSPIANSWKAEDFDKFSADFRKKWSAEHLGEKPDGYTTYSFNDTAVAAEVSQRHQFAQEAGKRLVNDTTDMMKSNMGGEIKKAITAGTTAQLPAILTEMMVQGRATGLPWGTLNTMVADAVLAQADENQDLALLDKNTGILQKMKTPGGTIGNIAEITERVTQMRLKISRDIQNDQHNANVAQKAAKESAESKVWAEFNEAQRTARKSNALGTLDIDPFTRQLDALGASESVAAMISAHSAYIGGNATIEDDDVKRRLNIGIHATAPGAMGYVTQLKLNKALAAHQINNATYDQFSAEITERDKGGAGGLGKFFSDPMLNQAEKDLSPWFARDQLGNLMPGQAQLMQKSVTYLRDQYIKWKATPEGSTATWDTANKWLSKMIPEAYAHFGNAVSQGVQKSFVDPGNQVDFNAPALLVNPKKQLTHDRSSIVNAEASYNNWKAGKGKISDAALLIFQDAGVDPANAAAVDEFFKAQRSVLKNPRPTPKGTP